VADNLDAIPGLVATAKTEGDWDALGYESWEAYVKGEFGTGLLKLDRAVRRVWSRALKDAGLSTREIAPVVNADQKTVVNDLREENSSGRSTEAPEPGCRINDWHMMRDVAKGMLARERKGTLDAAPSEAMLLEVLESADRIRRLADEELGNAEMILVNRDVLDDMVSDIRELREANESLGAGAREVTAENRKLRQKIKDLEARLAAGPSGNLFGEQIFTSVFSKPKASGDVYDAKTAKLINLAIDTDSDDEASVAFQQARSMHRKAKVSARMRA
jgi:hypothetical protein